MTSTNIDQHLHVITKFLNSSQQLPFMPMSTSSVSPMIPTPGKTSYGNIDLTISQDNTMISASGGDSTTQVALNVGNILPNESCVKERIPIVQQASQLIPTPGLNNKQSLSINSEPSNAGLFLDLDSPLISQQLHIDGRHNNCLPNSVRMEASIELQQNSPYISSNAAMNEGVGGLVTNMKHMNGLTVPEGYICPVSYGVSLKPLQQQLDKQQHPSLITVSISQQMLPSAANGYALSTPGSSCSGNNQNSNPITSSKQNTDPGMLCTKSMPLNKHASQLKLQMFDNLQSMNSQSAHLTHEQTLQSQLEMQSFEQSNRPSVQFIHDQRYQHNQHIQQLFSNSDNSRHFSMASYFSGQLTLADGIESSSDYMHPPINEKKHISDRKNHYQRNTSFGNLSNDAQLLDQLQGSPNVKTLPSHTFSPKLWETEQNEVSQNELYCLSVRSPPDALSKEHWYSQTQKVYAKEIPSFEQHAGKEFYPRVPWKDKAQSVKIIPDALTIVGHDPMPESTNKTLYVSNREQDYCKQKRWLLLLLHSRKCPSSEGQCEEVHCTMIQQLWMHMDTCNSSNCMFPRCFQSRKLFHHYMTCKAADCPVCIPVQEVVASVKVRICSLSGASFANKMNSSWKNIVSASMNNTMIKTGLSPCETSNCHQPSSKRMKVQNPSLIVHMKGPFSVPATNHFTDPKKRQSNMYLQDDEALLPYKSEVFEVKMNASLVDGWLPAQDTKFNALPINVFPAICAIEPCSSKEAENCTKVEIHPVDKEISHFNIERNQVANITSTFSAVVFKSGKPKIKGVSLTELFSIEQVKDHIISLRQWIGQSKTKAEKNQSMECSIIENSCQLCAVEKLSFEPPPIYCTLCGTRVKRNAMYYNVGTGDTRHYFCISCYNEARYDTIEADDSTFTKSKLEKKKNDEETEEWWVQCDKCEAWQHQICALFNGRRNDGEQAEYTCPNCYMEEIIKEERKPLPQSTILGAKDLPRTILSDHIEQHLFKRLTHERQARARYLGKSFGEVPGAEDLVVRVVSSVDKKLEMKQHFLEIFQEENYPSELTYKSKVILLFQKIEGVEVCLFGMYVQEFGSECQLPNQRRVYLSYLDSVKYFRPEIKTVSGEALRTFVYHEILIGYLDYCKKRGFTSCYIWACPPLKGEDYILYCHPEIQRTPKSDKLREWYLSMLRKASKEAIVVGLTNLYDHFFVSTGECKAKVTAARLPYFEGDYWPGAADDMINQLRQDEDDRKQQKKGKTKATLTKRALKTTGLSNLGCNASKDALLMQKLGEIISPMKEDFIMVHLQHACAHCCILMVSGNRWVCHICKHFQICDRCFEADKKIDERDRHPVNSRERHDLFPIEITNVLADTKDKDEIIESEFFDTRQAFLSLCQGNHYQYDTLRRAKHSSMMVLYHLHNPTAPAFVITCNVCYHDIETGQGWHCEVCPDFDVCKACYEKDGGINHPHKLTNHPSNTDRDAQSQEARQKRVVQLRKMLDLLVHASQCRFPHCQYPNCRKVKGLFRHGIQCKTRASKGCLLCKRMWYLLQLHSRACKESKCNVPRCKDLKDHLKRMQQQSESRRRAAVMEMMRQRAAELQGADN